MVLNHPTKCNPSNPLNMELININEHPWHMHHTMEIIYVLKGSLECNISIYPSVMNAGDIAVVNAETLHYYKGSEDNIVLLCHIDLSRFNGFIPDISDTLIICNSAAAVEYDRHYNLLKSALTEVFSCYFGLKASAQDELMDRCVDFLSILYNHFNFLQHEGAAIHSENLMKQRPLQADRVKRVMKYIYENLDSHITLEDIAAKEYVSKYYLSHLTSEFLKMPFREYLNMTRAVYAQDFLYGTDLSLSEIAASCGFSSTEAFRKSYLKYVGISPADDRKRIAGHTVKDIPVSDSDALIDTDIEDIAVIIGIKAYHTASANLLQDSMYPVTSIPVSFASFDEKPVTNTWDTVVIDDARYITSYRTLSALDDLHYYGLFSKVFIPANILSEAYTLYGDWDFAGTFLDRMKSNSFTLVTDRHSEIIDSLLEFCSVITGPAVQVDPEVTCADNAVHRTSADVISSHLSCRGTLPSLFKNGSDMPYLFDRYNHKTKNYYVYYFLNKMLSSEFYSDDCCYITHSDDRLSILLYSGPDSGIRKYMFNLKHLARNYICRTFKINEQYESEEDIYTNLSLNADADNEMTEIVRVKALPDVDLDTIAGLPEYNLFLSLPPDTVMLVELA